MPTVCKAILDGSDYRAELKRLVEESNAAKAELARPATATVTQTVEGSDEVKRAKQEIESLPKETELKVTADVASLPELNLSGGEDITISAAVDGLADVEQLSGDVTQLPDQTDIGVSANVDGLTDVEQLGMRIDKIPEDVTITVTSDTTQAEQGMDRVEDSTRRVDRAQDDAGKQVRKTAEQISKAGGAVGALAGALGTVNPQLGMMGQLFSAMVSGIVGIVAAAAGLVAAIAVGIWDNLTVSLEEAASKTDAYAASAERARQKEEEQQTALQKHMDKLRELSNAESTHKNALGETVAALDALERKYGDLGAQIDKTTGRITNFQAVDRRAREERAKQLGGKVSNELEAIKAQANAKYINFRKDESGQNRYHARNEVKAMDALPLETRLYIMRKRLGEATQKEAQDGYIRQIEFVEKMIELEKQLKSIRRTGDKSPEEAAAARLQKEGDVAAGKNTVEQMDRDAVRRKADNELSRLTDPDKKTANREGLITQEKARQADIAARIAQAEKEIASAQNYDEGLEAENRKLAAVAELKKSQADIASLENEITQIKHEQIEAARKLSEQSAFELEYARLLAAKEYDKAAALKQEYDLKQQNLKLDDVAKKKLLDEEKARKGLALKESLKDQAVGLNDQALRQAGQIREADLSKAYRDAEKQKGAKLDDGEKALVGQIADLSYSLNHTPPPQLGDLSVRTNALTSRGGFSTGAVVPDVENYNKNTANYARQLLETVQTLKPLLEKLGVVP